MNEEYLRMLEEANVLPQETTDEEEATEGPVPKRKKKKKDLSILPKKKKRKKKKSEAETEAQTGAEGQADGVAQAEGAESGAPSKPRKRLTEKQKTNRALKRLLKKVALLTAITALILIFVGTVTIYHDNAMFPSVKDGDLAIIFKPTAEYNGDIVAYKVDGESGVKLGRVVGIPGDTIDFRNDSYLINGTQPYESIYFATRKDVSSSVRFPYTVREGEVFVFNDMREDTKDSRLYGGIQKKDVVGKVVLIVRRRGF